MFLILVLVVVAFSKFQNVLTEDLNTFLRILESCEVDRGVALSVVDLGYVYDGASGPSLALASRGRTCKVVEMVF